MYDMKRLLCTAFVATVVALVVPNLAFAQKWHSLFNAADELKGEKAYYTYYYESVGGDCVCCWSNEANRLKIISGRGIFDYDDNYVSVLVGFYEGDTLVNKVVTKFYVPDGDSNHAYTSPYKNPTLGTDIINHLRTKGKVRIVASKYSGADFDLTIPQFDITTDFEF